MKRVVPGALLASLLLAGAAQAETLPYNIEWATYSFVSRGSQISAHPDAPGWGNTFFDVNGVPIPATRRRSSFVKHPNGDESLTLDSPFNSSLLSVGTNKIDFAVQNASGDSSKDLTTESVDLVGPGKRVALFRLNRVLAPFSGTKTINLGLREIDPGLADRLKTLENAINVDLEELIKNAAQIPELEGKLDRLSKLPEDVDNLLKKGFDQITPDDLAKLLAAYPDLSPATRDALVQLVADLKKDVTALRTELERISGEFRTQITQLDAALAPRPTASGFNPNEPGSFVPTSDPSTLPPISVPEILGSDEFDESNDPYAVYADQTISQLGSHLSGDSVSSRDGFMTVYETWRTNQEALERALKLRVTVSQKEYGAFLRARQRVVDFVRRFLDSSDWFKDAPVPQELKNLVDGVLTLKMAEYARSIKGGLNRWPGPRPTPQQQLVIDTLLGIGGGVESLDGGAATEDPDAEPFLRRALGGAVTAVKEAARIGVGLTPVGDFIDLCEAVTGRESCLPSGAELSTGGRVMSAMGMVIGSGRLWRGVGKFLGVGGKKVVNTSADFIESMSDLSVAERRAVVKRMKFDTLLALQDVTGREMRDLLDHFGDETVERLLLLRGKGLQELKAFKMFTPENLTEGFQSPIKEQFQKILADPSLVVRKLPSLKGKNLGQLQQTLTANGMELHPRSTAAQEIWVSKNPADNSVVRIALVGTTERPRPHFKKEISKVHRSDLEPDDILCKVTDTLELAPKGTNLARQKLNEWYRKLAGGGADARVEMQLEDIWADYTHFDL